MTLSRSEFAVTLYDLHRLQRAVGFEKVFESWSNAEKRIAYTKYRNLGLFIYRMQRDPGFAWHVLFRVKDAEQVLQQTIQYINTLWDIWGRGLVDLYTFPTLSQTASQSRSERLLKIVWDKFRKGEYICPFGCTANEIFLSDYRIGAGDFPQIRRAAQYLQSYPLPDEDKNLFSYFDPLSSRMLEREWKQYLLKNIYYPGYYMADKQHYCQNEMPYLPMLRKKFADACGFGTPDEAWMEAEWESSEEQKTYTEEQRVEQLQNLIFTTSAQAIAMEIWFLHLKSDEQHGLLNQEYPWPPEEKILRQEVPEFLLRTLWHPKYWVITSSPADLPDLRGPEIMEAIHLIESGRENDGYFLLISWFEGEHNNKIIHNIRRTGYAFLAHELDLEKILPQLCDILIAQRLCTWQEIADMFAEFYPYSCGEEWFCRQELQNFRFFEKADWYMGRAKVAYAAGLFEQARSLCQDAIHAAEYIQSKYQVLWRELPDCYLLMADIHDADGDIRGRHTCLYRYICSKPYVLERPIDENQGRQVLNFIQLEDLLSRTPLRCEAITDADDAKKTLKTAEYIQSKFREEGETPNIDYSIPLGWIGKGVELLINTKILNPARERISKECLSDCKRQDLYCGWKGFFYDKQTVSCGTFSRFIRSGEKTQNTVLQVFRQNLLNIYSHEKMQQIAEISQKIADIRNPSIHQDIFTKEEMDREWTKIVSLTNELIQSLYPDSKKQSETIDTLAILHRRYPDNPVTSVLLKKLQEYRGEDTTKTRKSES